MEYLIKGVLYGLILMFSAGPSFFYLIKVGMEMGFRKALGFALGIFISDLILLALIFLGLRPLFELTAFKQAFSLASGVLIAIFGLTMILRKSTANQNVNIEANQRTFGHFTLKGIGVNILNPFTVALWVGILGSVSPTNRYEFSQFIGGLLGVIFISDATKAFLAKLIGKAMTPRAVFILNKVLGIAFILIGAYFIFVFYQSFFEGNHIEMEVPDLN